jgi:hypothetical protein
MVLQSTLVDPCWTCGTMPLLPIWVSEFTMKVAYPFSYGEMRHHVSIIIIIIIYNKSNI